jgi:xylulokinase
MKGCVLAVDLGGSSLRVALIGRDGAVRAMHARPRRTLVEADPEDWWQALVEGAGVVSRKDRKGFAEIRAVAVTAFTRGMVLVDAAGTALRPAMLFGDGRAAEVLEELRGTSPTQPSPASAGEGFLSPPPRLRGIVRVGEGTQPIDELDNLDATHPLARLHWLSRHEPETLARARCVLEPKDYLNLRLTGVAASDPISSARLAASRDLAKHLSLPDLIPPLLRPHAPLATVQPNLPAPLDSPAGIPVIAMAHDTWAAVLGLGALHAGGAYCISGTTEVLGLLHDEPAHADGLLTVDWDGLWQIGGPSQHGADLLAWLHELGLDPLDQEPHDPVPILFLPTLEGERVPHWDTALRGAFLGLRREHDKRDMVRAAMLGVALNNRTVLTRAEEAAGRQVQELRLGGGGAMPGWAQLRAHVLGRSVVLTDSAEPGLLGCAIAGFAAVEGKTLAAMQRELVRESGRFEPDARRHERATQLHALFLQAERAVAPISRALAALS